MAGGCWLLVGGWSVGGRWWSVVVVEVVAVVVVVVVVSDAGLTNDVYVHTARCCNVSH